jgi:hypothetical protein
VEANGKDIIKIAPPILSRVYNQLGNGIVKLNNARKIHDFPIPFPLAQVITIMLLVHWFVTATVCALEAEDPFFAGFFSFVIIMSYWSINYIAVELEQPFGDDPNDLPLHEMQIDLNKSLASLLNNKAATPPKFIFYEDLHRKLERKQVVLDQAIAELKSRRPDLNLNRKASTVEHVDKTPHASPYRVSLHTGELQGRKSICTGHIPPQMPQMGSTLSMISVGAMSHAPSRGAGPMVDNCFDGACEKGSMQQQEEPTIAGNQRGKVDLTP